MKKSQLDTESDENPKIFQFSKFYAVFLENFQQTPEMECWKGSARNKCCPVCLVECLELTSKKEKFQNFLFSSFFFNYCQTIDRLCELEC